jgi:hypothetical protein
MFSARIGKETDKNRIRFSFRMPRNQSMYSVIARPTSVLGAISHFFSDGIDTAV